MMGISGDGLCRLWDCKNSACSVAVNVDPELAELLACGVI